MASFSKAYAATGAAGNRLDPIEWSNEIFTDALEDNALAGMMGEKGSGASIIIDEIKGVEAGDEKIYTMIPYQEEDPIFGNETSINNNSTGFLEYDLSVTFDIVSFSRYRKGRMTQARTIWDIRNWAKKQLTDRESQYHELAIFKAWTGVAKTVTRGTWEAAADTTDRVDGVLRCIRASGAFDSAAVTEANSDNTALNSAMTWTADKMNTRLIENAVIQAKTNSVDNSNVFLLNPLKRRKSTGDPMFCLYMSWEAARDLKDDPRYEKHALSLIEAGLQSDDGVETEPFAKGAFGVWDNVVLKRTKRVLKFIDVDVTTRYYARNLLVGADSAVLLFGDLQSDFTEEVWDHNINHTWATTTMRGEKKTNFNGVDMGVIQVITAS